jgi:hypothetical protein
MQQVIFSIILTFSILQGFSQTYLTENIIKKADSILNANSGEYAYPFFHFDNKTYYEYRKGIKLKWKNLRKKLKTKGKFKKCSVRFDFNNPNYPWIYGFVSIKFDSLLNLSEPINLSFIPKFLLEGKPSNFISKEKALKIGSGIISTDDTKKLEVILEYNFLKYKKYFWVIHNYLTEKIDRLGNKYGKVEIVLINPINGKIVEHFNTEYGTLN